MKKLLLIAGSFMALHPLPTLAHWHPAYSHDAVLLAPTPGWMAKLDDATRLSELSLPGTHDSMSRYGGDIPQTQTLMLDQQLNAGIRVLDLRLRAVDNQFAIYHGPVYQHADFGQALRIIADFLRANPSETVLARIKEEGKPIGSTLSFNQIFDGYYRQYRASIAIPRTEDPSLGEMRGKLVVLQQFAGPRYGLYYPSFIIQDRYTVASNWALYEKWENIKAQYQRAGARIDHAIYVNYLSASGGSFPYFVASGHASPGSGAARLATGLILSPADAPWPDFPRVHCLQNLCTAVFEGTNILSYDYLRRMSPHYVGIVMADFPGPGLINEIIRINFAKESTMPSIEK